MSGPRDRIDEGAVSGRPGRRSGGLPALLVASLVLLPVACAGPPAEETGEGRASVGDEAAVGPPPGIVGEPGPSEWTQHGFDLHNTAYNFRERRVTAATVARLRTRWTFPVNEAVVSTPAYVDGVVYFGSWEGIVYAVDADSGREIWSHDAREPVGEESAWARRGIGIRGGLTVVDGRVYVGDTAGYLTVLDADSGETVWRRRLYDHLHSRLFGAPKVRGDRVYSGVSCLEESAIRIDPSYDGYTFRGSVVSLQRATGELAWRFFTIPVEASRIGTKYNDRPVYGPAGVCVWASPALDPERGVVYVTTGQGYTGPEEHLTYAESLVALGMEDGDVRWSWQAEPGAEDLYTNERLGGENEGPGVDFGSAPILFGGPDGNRWVAAGQKSGVVHVLDPDSGEKLWEASIGEGGILFGFATDGERLFTGRAFRDGAVTAIDGDGGAILWQTASAEGSTAAPVTLAGPRDELVVFAGTTAGVLQAYDGNSGEVLWDFSFTEGTSIQGGAAIADGMVFVGAGYHSALGGARQGAGNELRAFSIDGE